MAINKLPAMVHTCTLYIGLVILSIANKSVHTDDDTVYPVCHIWHSVWLV